jgi:mannose-6-phosphate isomerase-like protein (cupin superfamily)
MPFVNPYELPTVERLPGWFGRFFSSDSMTFGYWEVAADAVPLHEHHHPQEEVWNLVDGRIAITVDGVEQVLEPGEAAIVPANAPHSARALSAARAIVVDHPTRVDLARPHDPGH